MAEIQKILVTGDEKSVTEAVYVIDALLTTTWEESSN